MAGSSQKQEFGLVVAIEGNGDHSKDFATAHGSPFPRPASIERSVSGNATPSPQTRGLRRMVFGEDHACHSIELPRFAGTPARLSRRVSCFRGFPLQVGPVTAKLCNLAIRKLPSISRAEGQATGPTFTEHAFL